MRLRAAARCVVTLCLFLAACGGGQAKPNTASSQLAFGVDMARRGLWQEALFRFQEAEKLEPQNPRIQSNLGVAYEAAGQFDKALAAYQNALRIAPDDKDIRANYSRFVEFYQGFKGDKTGAKAGEPKPPEAPPAGGGAGAALRPEPAPGEPSPPEDTPPPPMDNRPPR